MVDVSQASNCFARAMAPTWLTSVGFEGVALQSAALPLTRTAQAPIWLVVSPLASGVDHGPESARYTGPERSRLRERLGRNGKEQIVVTGLTPIQSRRAAGGRDQLYRYSGPQQKAGSILQLVGDSDVRQDNV